ncbi:putative small mechanosensitive ion channel, MscS family [Crocosphaera subtropica ATCC 51142]|uniref:Small mechanosensitive ion channel, MscS family n=2 Tax=Crocosphaera TaxID=263510 RepID=B1WZL8_CROS5|nr:putative small mechanosensitive ion channel, MscS family [Crocosphaera subtropica ATCC 51142]
MIMTVIIEYFTNLFQFDEAAQKGIITFGLQLLIFLVFVLLSLLIGRYTPFLARLIIQRFSPKQVASIYGNLITPIEDLFRITGTLILVSISLNFLVNYTGIYRFLNFFIDLAVISSFAWLCSRLFRQFVRFYGIDLVRKLGRQVDELLLVFETIANVIIGFIAVLAFAQSQQVNLVGLLASLGIGGLAIAFAAQKTLEQLLGTCVLYLDRPFIPGEYIRLPSGLFGRVESIGLRSTKIRTAAKSTLMIVPNSIMANLEIENVTRGKKVMVLLYLDFLKQLEDSEQALVEQVVKESTDALFGIDPGSTKISLFPKEGSDGIRARVTFFILGSSENSIELRKRLLELANETITNKLSNYGIEFTVQEPTIYVESPVTI